MKQLDFDGRFEYSKVIAIDQKGNNTVSVFPNPSNGSFTISGLEHYDAPNILIINNLGQKIPFSQTDNQIDISTLQSGIYLLQVMEEGQVVKTLKIVKE